MVYPPVRMISGEASRTEIKKVMLKYDKEEAKLKSRLIPMGPDSDII